jgi:hypothetical protein
VPADNGRVTGVPRLDVGELGIGLSLGGRRPLSRSNRRTFGGNAQLSNYLARARAVWLPVRQTPLLIRQICCL